MRAELLADLVAAQAARARETAVERYAECRRQGKAIGKPALGMKWAGPRGRRRQVPDDRECATLLEIQNPHAAGMTLDEIYFELLGKGILRSSGQEWSRTTIWQIANAVARQVAHGCASP